MKLDRSHPLAQGLELWLPSQAPYAGGGRWYNIARPYNDGTANGAVAWHGYRNKGYGFTGNGSTSYYQVESTGLNDLPSVGMAIGVSVRWTATTVGMSALGFGRSSSATPFLVVGSGDTTGSRARAVFRSDAGTTVNFQSSGNYNDGLWHRFFFWRSNTSGGNYRFSVDGVSLSTTSLAANPITIDRLAVGSLIRNTVGSYWNGGVSDAMVWRLGTDDKPLDDLEMMRWDYEEWQRGFPSLLSRNRSVMVFLPAGGGSYTLTSNLGTYALSGQDATLRNARRIAAENATYTLSGQAATARVARLLTSALGTYTESGQDASLLAARRLTSAAATYTLTGQTATLLRALKVAGGLGGFTLNGQDATLDYSGSNPLLDADLGGFTLSGQTVGLLRGLKLAAAVGTLTESGQDATLRRGLRLVIGDGTYTLSGIDANLAKGLGLVAGVGAFTVAGQDAGFLRTRRLTSALGTFTLTGQPATLTYSGASDSAPITFTGFDLSLDITFTGLDLSRDLTFSGFDFE